MHQTSSRRVLTGLFAVVMLAISSLAVTSSRVGAATPVFAPVNQPGPPLSVPAATLAKAMSCSQPLTTVKRDVILMIPPTVFDPGPAYSWNYMPAFKAKGWPYCTFIAPNHTDNDIQINAEYVVYAVRQIFATTHRKVELFGWSQGASTSPRWALRWWPDIRPMVATLAALAPVNEGGGTVLGAICTVPCIPAAWQQLRTITGAQPHFMQALNSGQQSFPGIAYTEFYSLTDEVAGLNLGADPVGPLPAAPNVLNVSEQSICPTQLFEHLTIPAASSAYAVLMAALANPGHLPDITAIKASNACRNPLMPFVTPESLAVNEGSLAIAIGTHLLEGDVPKEPALACYTTNTCKTR